MRDMEHGRRRRTTIRCIKNDRPGKISRFFSYFQTDFLQSSETLFLLSRFDFQPGRTIEDEPIFLFRFSAKTKRANLKMNSVVGRYVVYDFSSTF